MESSTAVFLTAVGAFARTPTVPFTCEVQSVGVSSKDPCCLFYYSGNIRVIPFMHITAFTSLRTNLSPFTKGCRERDASM